MNPWWLYPTSAALVVAGWFLHRRVLQPLREMRVALRDMAAGNAPERPLLSRDNVALSGVRSDLIAVAEGMGALRRRISEESVGLRAVLRSMVEGVAIVDSTQRVRLANDALARMFGLPASPADRTLLEISQSHELARAAAAALSGVGPQQIELRQEVREGGRYVPRHFAVTVVAIDAPAGGSVAAVAIFHDVTGLKALEAVRREFVANISHELRTPLSVIGGSIETLLDGALDSRETATEFLEAMRRHSDRISALVEDLLALSALESRAVQLEIEQVDLGECVRRSLDQVAGRIADGDATIDLLFPEGLPALEADRRRLEQIFSNLIDNALKHVGPRPPRIAVSAGIDGDAVTVRVADNGPGIPLADQAHVFERFYRVHKDRSRGAGGSGLGLSIVRHAAEAHGGRVWLESVPGEGSVFCVRLPIRQTPAGRPLSDIFPEESR